MKSKKPKTTPPKAAKADSTGGRSGQGRVFISKEGQGSGRPNKTRPRAKETPKPAAADQPMPEVAQTSKAAAGYLKVSLHDVKRAKVAGCTAWMESGRVHLATLKEWLNKNKPDKLTQVSNGEVMDLVYEKALDTRAARQLKEEKLKKNRGEVFSKNEVNHEWVTNIITAKNLLQDAANEIVVEMQMKSVINTNCVDACRDILSRRIRSALKVLNSGKFSRPICPNCQHEIKGDAPWVDSKPVEQTHNDGTGI